MALLICYEKGRRVKLQTDPAGIERGEYCFVNSSPVVGKEECLNCRSRYCVYGFNLRPLVKNRELRERVLDYVFDASLDDELLLNGIVPRRELYLTTSSIRGKIYSKPCYDEETAQRLVSLDEAFAKGIQTYYRTRRRLDRAIAEAEPLPPRVIKRLK